RALIASPTQPRLDDRRRYSSTFRMGTNVKTWVFNLRCSIRVALSLVLLTTCVCGCRLVRTTAEMPGKAVKAVTPGKKAEDKPADPVDLQQKLMRFADDFSARMVSGIDNLRRGTNRLERLETQRLKLRYVTDTMAIATGPNAFANLLDMV